MDISTLLLHTTFIVVILLLHGIFGAAILNCPTNLTSSSSVVDYGDKVYTTDPDRYTIACVPEIGQNVADGTHVVTCNAWQGFQYLDICRFRLIVDTKVPNITCPSNQLNSSSTIYYDVISTDDIDTSPSVECSPQSGSNFSEGVTTVLCSAWDYAKNNVSCNFTVTIVSWCQDSWHPFEGSCYRLFEERLNWFESFQVCRGNQASLATVDSEEKHTFVVGLRMGTRGAWIGFNDIDEEGVWQWTTAGNNSFTMWLEETAKPNGIDYSYSSYSTDGDCARVVEGLNGTTGWLDRDCKVRWNGFICEKVRSTIHKTTIAATDDTFTTPPVVSTTSGPPFTEEVTPVYGTNEAWNDSVTTGSGCQVSWHPFEGSCYRLFEDPLNWLDSLQVCKENQASLATVDTEPKHTFIVGIRSGREAWIGLNDIDEEGVWKWASGAEYNNFTMWLEETAEPNNRDHYRSSSSFSFASNWMVIFGDCASVVAGSADGTGWLDRDCQNRKNSFICEKGKHT